MRCSHTVEVRADNLPAVSGNIKISTAGVQVHNQKAIQLTLAIEAISSETQIAATVDASGYVCASGVSVTRRR